MASLHDLYTVEGQSPWLDNLKRSWLRSGEIQRWIDRGVRGITSNPAIFAAAITGSDDYTDQLRERIGAGADVESAYWDLVVDDIVDAAHLLAPLYESSGGVDGRVSVEVDPRLAREQGPTEVQALELWKRIAEPNVMIKIPATVEGLGAIRSVTAAGVSVNVTLIFSVDRYRDVMEAYLAGLEDASSAGIDLSSIHSVASFFISRVDSEVDRRLLELGTADAVSMVGTAAVAQGRLAYQAFRQVFSGPRWEALAANGAQLQRPLWASTSTKNPDFPDTLYVDELIGPDSVNTIPEPTLVAFEDHGTVARTVDVDLDAIDQRWNRLGQLVDLDDVAAVLEAQGVTAFENSFDDVLDVLRERARSL